MLNPPLAELLQEIFSVFSMIYPYWDHGGDLFILRSEYYGNENLELQGARASARLSSVQILVLQWQSII